MRCVAASYLRGVALGAHCVRRCRVSCHSSSRRAVTLAASAGAAVPWNGSTERELHSFLHAHGVDTSSWGVGVAKTVSDLFQETQQQETTVLLQPDGTLTRHVRVVQLAVRDPARRDRVLVEASQVLPDGRERRRNVLLSEKAMANEDWQDAALRGIREELGSILGDVLYVRLREQTYQERTVRKASPSYPTLASQYVVLSCDADVQGLPVDVEAFSTEEERADGTLRSNWEWRTEVPPDTWF